VRKILGLIVLLAILTGVDLLARNVAEQQTVDQVKSSLPANAKVSASIPTFPFVPRILFRGSIPKVTVKVQNLTGPPIDLAEVDVTVTGVQINRHDLFNKRRVELVAIDKGSVAVVVTQNALSDVLHVPVQIGSGRVTVVVSGQTLTVVPTITTDNKLELKPVGAGAPLIVGLGQANLVPCAAKVTIEEAKVRVSCTLNRIPPAFVRAANGK
jgi:hypothetical protein